MDDVVQARCIEYDPVSRQIVTREPWAEIELLVADYEPPKYFDLSSVNVPADRMSQ